MHKKTEEEIKMVTTELGDPTPTIRETLTRGIIGVETKAQPRQVIKKAKEMFNLNPWIFNFAVKWIPIDKWCRSEIEEMRKVVQELRLMILSGEKWAMKVEKRRFEAYETSYIIKELAKEIPEKVDLTHPDKILLIEIIGDFAGFAVLKPSEIFSLARPES